MAVAVTNMADTTYDESNDEDKPAPEYWITIEEADAQVSLHEENTGTNYTLIRSDPNFGSASKYS